MAWDAVDIAWALLCLFLIVAIVVSYKLPTRFPRWLHWLQGSPSPPNPSPDRVESSTSCDWEHVHPLLERMVPLIDSGFSSADVSQIMTSVEEMKTTEGGRRWDFRIVHDGKPCRFQVGVFVDDIESAGIYFLGPKELAGRIEAAMEKFAVDMGTG